MASRWTVRFACPLAVLFGFLAPDCVVAQGPSQAVLPKTTNDALHAMSQLAGVIFTGQVVAVRRFDAVNGATGVVEITFAVEDAVRGVSGSTYTLREWAGLWPAGDEPFRVGQRYLMLLHAPSAAGLSSPIGGMDGAIPIRGSMQAQASGSAESIIAPKTISAEPSPPQEVRVVDLSWVATHVVQPLSYRTAPLVNPTALPVSVDVDAVRLNSASGSQAAKVGVSDAEASVAPIDAAAPASHGTPYTSVLGMLRGWEKTDHATR